LTRPSSPGSTPRPVSSRVSAKPAMPSGGLCQGKVIPSDMVAAHTLCRDTLSVTWTRIYHLGQTSDHAIEWTIGRVPESAVVAHTSVLVTVATLLFSVTIRGASHLAWESMTDTFTRRGLLH
jgi:hypothetical protein